MTALAATARTRGHAVLPITRAAHALYASLLSAGVRVYEYLRRMLRAKSVAVDRRWATLGSANLD